MTFSVEELSEFIEEMKPLLLKNHLETGVYDRPFNPDYDRYLELAGMGCIKVMTVRDDGVLVGYALFFIDSQIYQKEVTTAVQSLFYIDPECRGTGYKFMKYCDDILKECGVNSVWRQATAKKDIGPLYKRMGYRLIENTYLREF